MGKKSHILKFRTVILAIIFSLNSPVYAKTHIVKQGETLGTIAQSLMTDPQFIWGSKGRLALLLKNNPTIKNGDVIYPGQQLVLIAEDSVQVVKLLQPTKPARVPSTVEAPAPAPIAAAAVAPTPAQIPVVEKKSPAPIKAIAVVEEAVDAEDLTVSVKLSPMFSRMDSTDRTTGAKAAFVSELIPAIEIGLTQKLGENHEFTFNISHVQNKYQQPSTFQNLPKVPATNSLEASYHYLLTSRIKLGAGVGMAQKLFPRSVNLTDIGFDAAQVPYWELELDYTLIKFKRSQFGLGYSHKFLGEASVPGQEIKSGYEQFAKAFLKQRRKSFEFSQEIFWRRGIQDSSIVDQDEKSVGLGLGLSYDF